MKTITSFIISCAMLFATTSCMEHYKIVTTVHPDASCFREIYAKTRTPSSFLAGDMSANPYLFHVDSSWQITPVEKDPHFNVKIGKTFRGMDEISPSLSFEEHLRPVVAPVEHLQKRFRWFYTYYSFKAVYPSVAAMIPAPIDEYMSKAQQKMWFQGDFSDYNGMNGFELKDELDDADKNFEQFVNRFHYEFFFNALHDLIRLKENEQEIARLVAAKDSLRKDFLANVKSIFDVIPEEFNTILNARFPALYERNKPQLDSLWAKIEEDKTFEIYEKEITYELLLPGKLLHANASFSKQDTLVWKVTAMRFTLDDYELTAESRRIHAWAFILLFLLVAIVTYYLIKSHHSKKTYLPRTK
jgi:hypothetical protein